MTFNVKAIIALLCCASSVGIVAQETSVKQPVVTFVTPSIVRVQWVAQGVPQDNGTGVCIYPHEKVKVKTKCTESQCVYRTSQLVVELNRRTGALTFKDAQSGDVLLREDSVKPREAKTVVQERITYDESSARMVETANGKVTVKDVVRRDTIGTSTYFRNRFCFRDDEALYGFGSHMEDYMNLNGKTLYLTQHNLKAFVPVLVSNEGYGLLFDAGCAMKFDCDAIEYEAACSMDYYFMKGETMDDVVGQYRYLTGQVSLMPRYLFGYIQSKERYVSSDDLLRTLGEYRRRQVPIDLIVQDWNYWPQGWGYLKMNPQYYPDPKALSDSIHAMHARIMVSIWPNPQYCPQATDFKERGYMLQHDVYDAFNPAARDYYWKYVNDEFFSRGFDAWWCDSSEPLDGDWNQLPPAVNGKPYGWDDHARRYQLNKDILSDALGAERSSLYSLYHSQGIYENQRKVTDSIRVVNLTRSAYAGQQRYGTIVWNGDTHASWASFKQQIPAGLNYMATGCPYWTVDVGSFFVKSDQRWFYKGEFPQGVKDDNYKEYYTRMFQWATFLPLLRSHGSDTPREIWRFGEPGTPYYDAILRMINLRYEILPYIYSMAAMQTFGNYTMARALAFDFPHDKAALDIKDEYLFGRILVCPVTEAGVTKRRVYLPASSENNEAWIDYWTGKCYQGGQWIEAEAPIDRLPLFVRSGTIIPTTAVTQWADAQIGKPLTLHIYPGKDASFTFYEDQGDGYDYEKSSYCTIPLKWDDDRRILTIGRLEGNYPGMPLLRQITVEVEGKSYNVIYEGKTIKIKTIK